MNWARNSTRFGPLEAECGGWMFAIAAMGAVCAAGIGFYVRFLLALCTRCIHRQICYLVRLEPGRNEDPLLSFWRWTNPSVARHEHGQQLQGCLFPQTKP